MARPLRIQFPGACYHLACRGIERRTIFGDDEDRSKFLSYLWDSANIYHVNVLAYALMPNHFHLLVQTRKSNCSEFMRHFNIRYTGWFNWRHRRCGNLYQGRYKAILVDADKYLLEVSRYLHLNPVRSGLWASRSWAERWRQALVYGWSSLRGYVGIRKLMTPVDHEKILSMVGGRSAYREFVIDGLRGGLGNPFDKVTHRIILGDEEFLCRIKGYLNEGSTREQAEYRDITCPTLEPQELLGILAREYGIDEETLKSRGMNGVVRGMVAELLYRYSDITQQEIGQMLGGIDYMSVSQLRRRLQETSARSPAIRKRFAILERCLKGVM